MKTLFHFLEKRNKSKNQGIEKELLEEIKYDILLGNQHEMQHQELMIYDFQHYFQRFRDAEDNYKPIIVKSRSSKPQTHYSKSILENKNAKTNDGVREALDMVTIGGGIYELGFHGKGFCYDNELPENKTYLQQYKIDVFPVTNGDYIKFMNDDGYHNYKYWLADGWDQEYRSMAGRLLCIGNIMNVVISTKKISGLRRIFVAYMRLSQMNL